MIIISIFILSTIVFLYFFVKKSMEVEEKQHEIPLRGTK